MGHRRKRRKRRGCTGSVKEGVRDKKSGRGVGVQTEECRQSDPRLKFLMTLRVNNRSQGFHTGTKASNSVATLKRRAFIIFSRNVK